MIHAIGLLTAIGVLVAWVVLVASTLVFQNRKLTHHALEVIIVNAFINCVCAFIIHDFLAFWMMCTLLAIAIWNWWNNGGNDKWKKLKKWTKSKIKMPKLIVIRPIGVPV